MPYGLPRIGLAVIAIVIAFAPVSTLAKAATRPSTTAPATDTWPKLVAELAGSDLQTRESARVQLMRLARSDLPALRDLFVKSRPLLPAQAVVMREIVQEIYLSGEPYQTSDYEFATDPEVHKRLQQIGANPPEIVQLIQRMQAVANGDIKSEKVIDGIASKLSQRLVQKSTPVDQQIPSADIVHSALRQLQEMANSEVTAPKYGFLGILMEPPRADIGADNDGRIAIGVVVADRIPGFCAARNLIDGDIILGIAAPFVPFRGQQDLTNAIGASPPGTVVGLLVLRRGQIISITLTLDPRPATSLLENTGELFRAERQKKFDAYWQTEFKPLLSSQLG